ncbi:MAG: SRPBCC domain-containing protein [Candidatus Dadabacteria bacterium]|nr:SRPBCC domain-containing protein [Candidatus Dadabacteria bacterium]NIS07588.1 SRPBCC domain-containing protein [Candidatus Dadabacteria bacterium]NIY21222.1 hypothetical protein [Candidatus Dadabacteria bacterium]
MDEIIKRITINAEIEKVWVYITDSEKLAQWLMPNNFEPRINKKFELECPGHKDETHEDETIECEVLEIVPYKKLEISWYADSIGSDTKATINLEQSGDGVTITLIHSGWDKLDAGVKNKRDEYDGGWQTFINQNLVRALGQ